MDLILIAFRSSTYSRLILIRISRRTHTYSDSSYTVLSLYIYLHLSPVGHILMLVSDVYLLDLPKDIYCELILILVSDL